MELSQFGDLFDVVSAKGGFKNSSMTRFVFTQILEGTGHLHKSGYSHLDLKLDNILIGNDFKLKLCDFGMAAKVEEPIQKKLGTEGYMAPEVVLRKNFESYYGIQADIFSLGVILFILYFGQPPFNKADVNNDRFYSILVKKAEHFWRLQPTCKRVRDELKVETIDPSLIDLLTKLLSKDLDKRPASIDEIMKHKFISEPEIQKTDGDFTETFEEQFKSLV